MLLSAGTGISVLHSPPCMRAAGLPCATRPLVSLVGWGDGKYGLACHRLFLLRGLVYCMDLIAILNRRTRM